MYKLVLLLAAVVASVLASPPSYRGGLGSGLGYGGYGGYGGYSYGSDYRSPYAYSYSSYNLHSPYYGGSYRGSYGYPYDDYYGYDDYDYYGSGIKPYGRGYSGYDSYYGSSYGGYGGYGGSGYGGYRRSAYDYPYYLRK